MSQSIRPSGYSHSCDVAIANALGLNAAHVFNHICFWIRHNLIEGKNIRDGHTWMYDSYEKIGEYLTYLSIKEIRTAIKVLVDAGLLIRGEFNKNKFDHTTWYALADESIIQISNTKLPKGQIDDTKRADRELPNGTIEDPLGADPSLYTTYRIPERITNTRKDASLEREKKDLTHEEFHGSHVKFKPNEYSELCTIHGKKLVDSIIDEMNDYCQASKPSGYKSYAAAMRQWIRNREKQSLTKPNNFSNPTVDRRTKNKDGTPADSPYEGRF